MINYVAHWDRILIQSRSQIINELSEYRFRSICPVGDGDELKKHYAESINWQITREKYFDFSAIISLRKIIKNLDNGSVFHIFTLKTGFLFMISNLFLNKNFKSTLSITGLGYFFSNNISAKIFKIILRPVFITLINKTYENIIYQNIEDESTFNKYSKFKNKSYLIEGSGINTSEYLLKNKFNKNIKIILAGRLLKDKGIDDYIKLSKKFSSKKLTFFLAGEVDKGNPNSFTLDELEILKKTSSVNYLGYIDLQKEMQNYDLLLSLSEHEGFSRVLLEAMYVGLFVVAYQNNGTEYINNFENTILLNSKDINYLEKKINEFLNQKVLISNQNRKQIERSYSTRYVASQFAQIYNEKRDD
tara:strand:- start:241 stop:1320 length:1080 start_codon:yes stop_codon:yes gene_type:complete